MHVSRLLPAALLLATICSAAEPGLVARGIVSVPRASSMSPTSGIGEEWKIHHMVPAGRNRYLALASHERYRMDRWADARKLARERDENDGLVTSVVPEVLEDGLTLLILRGDGKVLDEAETTPDAPDRVSPFPGSHAVPLVMDATDACPYAILHPATRRLLCYDLDLHYLGRHEIPLDEIRYPRVTFDGERYTLWLFGKKYATSPEVKSFADAAALPPEPAVAYGVRFVPDRDRVEPLPLDGAALLDELQRIARGPSGERLQLHPASVAIAPFRDLDDDEPFWVLVKAMSSGEYESRRVASGTRLFFRARLGSQGLGTLEQLPFWIVQEERGDVMIDEEAGVLRFPRYLVEDDLQAFSFGRNDLALHLLLGFNVPRDDGSFDQRGRWLQELFLIFSGTRTPPHIIDLNDDRLAVTLRRELSTDRLTVHPVLLSDRIGTSEFAFRAICSERRGKGRRPCMAILGLEF